MKIVAYTDAQQKDTFLEKTLSNRVRVPSEFFLGPSPFFGWEVIGLHSILYSCLSTPCAETRVERLGERGF